LAGTPSSIAFSMQVTGLVALLEVVVRVAELAHATP